MEQAFHLPVAHPLYPTRLTDAIIEYLNDRTRVYSQSEVMRYALSVFNCDAVAYFGLASEDGDILYHLVRLHYPNGDILCAAIWHEEHPDYTGTLYGETL